MNLKDLKMPIMAAAADAAAAIKAKAMSPEEVAKRAKIAETAQSFEASFLSTMMQQMSKGVEATSFGGGEGEKAFKSVLMDAFAKQTAKAGGLGISDQVGREMLKLQGLT